jgi:perosamine synthetase
MNMDRIPIAKPVLGEEEIEAVVRVLKSGRLTRGEETRLFEKEFAEYVGCKHAITVMNGTVALEAMLKAIGVKGGDEVIVPDLTFIATANSVLNVGGKPVFADVKEDTVTIDPESVKEKITRKTKAIIAVHLYGHPADMRELAEIAADHRIFLLEDAAQSHGASINGRKTGCLGNAAAFSFYATKNMMTGEGGMVTTNDDGIAERLRKIRCHGETERYVSDFPGSNLHMTEMQAAIGRIQLRKLDELNEKRRMNAEYYDNELGKINGIVTPVEKPGYRHVYHQYVIKVEEEHRDRLRSHLESSGVSTAIHYPIPLHEQPLYKKLGYPQNQNPVAKDLSKRVLSIPVHPSLTKKQLEYIVASVKSYFTLL